jgi:hypothetical protein
MAGQVVCKERAQRGQGRCPDWKRRRKECRSCERKDAGPDSNFADVASTRGTRVRMELRDLTDADVLWMPGYTPKSLLYEFLVVLLVGPRTAPCGLLAVCDYFKGER